MASAALSRITPFPISVIQSTMLTVRNDARKICYRECLEKKTQYAAKDEHITPWLFAVRKGYCAQTVIGIYEQETE